MFGIGFHLVGINGDIVAYRGGIEMCGMNSSLFSFTVQPQPSSLSESVAKIIEEALSAESSVIQVGSIDSSSTQTN